MARCSYRGPSGAGGDGESEGALSCDAGSEMGRAVSPGPRGASRSREGREWSPPCSPGGPAPCTPGAEPSETCFTCGLRSGGARDVTFIPGHQGLGHTIRQDGDLEGGRGRGRGGHGGGARAEPSSSLRILSPVPSPGAPPARPQPSSQGRSGSWSSGAARPTGKGLKQAAALPIPCTLSSCGP